MLPIRSLDNQMFEDIVMRARRRISRLTPEWTDENLHDPGITMIELLAYMKEMQQYHLDRVPVRNVDKFLKLLGARGDGAKHARTNVWVRACSRMSTLPEGTPFAAGDIVFETERKETIVTAQVRALITRTHAGVTVSREVADVHEAFGAEPKEGDELFVCLSENLPVGCEINLSILLASAKNGWRNPITPEFIPLSEVEFSYSADGEWRPLRVVSDETGGFLQSGLIRVAIMEPMSPASEGPAAGYNAIRCCLLRSEFDDAPRLEMVQINALPVAQIRTLVHWIDMDCAQGRLVFPLEHHMALCGKTDVFAYGEEGFTRLQPSGEEHESGLYRVEHKDTSASLVFSEPPRCQSLRVVFSAEGIERERLFEGDGLPGQRAELPGEGLLMPDITLMEMDAHCVYREYKRVDNFDCSMPGDRHFCWDGEAGELVFGDGKNGMPPSGTVYVIRHARTLGAGGNVKAGEIRQFAAHAALAGHVECTLENSAHVSGGADEQTQSEALSMARSDISRPSYAVTLPDYEAIAKQTPGLVIRRACALAMIPPGVTAITGMNAVTVVVEAGTGGTCAGLSPAQKENLLRHLNRYRLVTTRVYVIPPEYVSIQIHCDVRVKALHLHPEEMIQQTLEEYFSTEWPFGRSVQYADIYGLLDTLECVSAVQALTIGAQGRGVQIDASGDVILPPHGLVVLEPCVCRTTTR